MWNTRQRKGHCLGITSISSRISSIASPQTCTPPLRAQWQPSESIKLWQYLTGSISMEDNLKSLCGGGLLEWYQQIPLAIQLVTCGMDNREEEVNNSGGQDKDWQVGVFTPQGSNSPQAVLAECYRMDKCPRLSGNWDGWLARSARVGEADLHGQRAGSKKCWLHRLRRDGVLWIFSATQNFSVSWLWV